MRSKELDGRLSVSDWAVLALLAEGPSHGFRLASLLAKNGALGFVWTIQRPQVYRALEHLEAKGLACPVRQEEGEGGPPRTLYAVTDAGRVRLEGWLLGPVAHLREGRSELLLKLAFLTRSKRDATPLIKAQRERFSELQAAHQTRFSRASGADRIVLAWRLEMAQAALRFLETLPNIGHPPNQDD